MEPLITTKSVAPGVVEVEEDFILSEEPMSRLIFHAQIHDGGIRGRIIRQRRESLNDVWTPEKAIPIRSLGKNETINLECDTEAVKNLYLAIRKLAYILKQKGTEYGEHKYAVVDPQSVIVTDENKKTYIKKIIEAGFDEEIWESLVEAKPSLATKLSFVRIQQEKKEVIKELAARLAHGNYSETSGPDSWQQWIYTNNWLFGVNYKKPIEKVKISVSGVMPDYLFPTLDGFVDILEIKLPEDEVVIKDPSHAGSWRWTSEANTAIGQVVNYLGEIDRLRLELEKVVKDKYGYEICFLKPRAYVLIGNSTLWLQEKKEGLRKMNNALHGIEVLTYKDLQDRGIQSLNIEL